MSMLAACKTLANARLSCFLSEENGLLQPNASRDRGILQHSHIRQHAQRQGLWACTTEPHSFLAAFCLYPGNHAIPSDGLARQLEPPHRRWRHD